MIRLVLVLFAAVVLVLLAAGWLIHGDFFQWQCGALAAYVIAQLPFNDVAVPTRKSE